MHKHSAFLNARFPLTLTTSRQNAASATLKSSFIHRSTCSMTDRPTTPSAASKHKISSSSPSAATSATPTWTQLLAYSTPIDVANGSIVISSTKEKDYVRLFGCHESELRLVFYRDHALWCPYCHKVQLLLELKQIPYKVKKVNMSCYGKKSVDFLKKVPSGLLPVIELDGKIITESMDIMFLIEETFAGPYIKTIPAEDNDMMQAFHRFMRLERVYIGAWLSCLRGPFAVLDQGMKPVHHSLDLIESCLGEFQGPFFYPGDLPSFVDINFSSIFERSSSSLKYWRNIDITEGRPNITKWFAHWQQWGPSGYFRSDDWTHVGALPPQIGPVRFLRTRSPLSLLVETSRNLHVLNDGPERSIERNIAATTLCRNCDVVVPDAIRGSTSTIKKEHEYIDHALRVIAQVLFDPDLLEKLEERIRNEIPKDCWKVVGDGIRFERIRGCAPRDMPLSSMEQFAGAINWLLRTLEQEL